MLVFAKNYHDLEREKAVKTIVDDSLNLGIQQTCQKLDGYGDFIWFDLEIL